MTTTVRDTSSFDELLDIVERLSREFTDTSAGEVTRVIIQCRQDLSGVPVAALPEMVERLARVRLST